MTDRHSRTDFAKGPRAARERTRGHEIGKSATSAIVNVDVVHDEVEARLRLHELRYTSGRRAIVDLLVRAGHPVSISEIADSLPELPQSSAYRHLAVLQNTGLVRRVAANDDFARFELAEDLTEHHHHLHCLECGMVIDVTPTPTFERTLTKAVAELSRAVGFLPHGHRLDALGLCARCG